MIKALKVINTDNPEMKFIQDNIDYVFKSVAVEPMIAGNILKDVSLSATTAHINHKLERQWVGFFITKSKADVNVYWDSTSTGDNSVQKERSIALKATATAVVDLYIF